MAPPLILTVDVEDWFHLCGHPIYSDPARWGGFVPRVEEGTSRLLDVLARTGSTATFFVLGWVARRHPGLLRRIAGAGHEVGCRGDLHRRVSDLTLPELRADLREARASIEDVLGERVTAFRAPEWSIRTVDDPALAVLVEEGFSLDSSLMPVPPLGSTRNPRRPVLLPTAAGPILEVPVLTGSFLGFPAMLGGGWTGRLSRLGRVWKAIEASIADGVPPVLYIHPWEADGEHPAMELTRIESLVHFAGRSRAVPRLEATLGRFPSRSLRESGLDLPAAREVAA